MTSFGNAIKLRQLEETDIPVLAGLFNNRKIWNMLRDGVPSPYHEKDARDFYALSRQENTFHVFAIAYSSEFSGCITLNRQTDVYRMSAELGYWVGEPYWGKGIATQAVNMICDFGFQELGLARIFAGVFDCNHSSQRVLQKAGFQLEGIARRAVIKNGSMHDEYRYARIHPKYEQACP